MGKKLYFGNLSYDTTDEKLKEACASFGTVESASVIVDKFSGRSKGFGFVEMANDDEALKVIENLNGKDLDGRQIKVNEARPMEKREPRSGGFGGGGGGGSRGGPRGGGRRRDF